MKLAQKLTAAFLLVSLTAIGLAAGFVWFTTSTQFSRYLLDQRQAEFAAAVREYYQVHGGWSGVDAALQERGLLPPPAAPGSAAPDPQPFGLVGADRVVIIPGKNYQAGQKVQRAVLERGIPIEIDGVVVGTVLTTGQKAVPKAIEQRYIDSVNRSLLIAGSGAALAALLLGQWIARSLTNPLRRLTAATRALAVGHFGQQVPVRTRDELGELAASFNQMSADLNRALQSRNQMTADIAHDLRNPLTVLSGYLESLEDRRLKATPERIAAMQNEVRRLKRLVEDLRMLSLADAGELTLHLQPIAPAALLDRAASGYLRQAKQGKVELVVTAETGLPELRLDPDRMEQVLGNLLSNALCYTPPGGTVKLSARRAGSILEIEVQDTGSGIPADVLPRIFERSFRGDRSRSGDGSGLGLTIARSIVELHRGQLKADSPGEGQGSTFTISLPTDL